MSGPAQPKSKPRRKPKSQRDTVVADTLFGQIVRAPGRCVDCGSTEFVQCAHGFTRSYRATRWDLRNAFCLCRACHVKYTHRPLEWDQWLRDRWGEELYAEIRAKALSYEKVDMPELIASLRARLAPVAPRVVP